MPLIALLSCVTASVAFWSMVTSSALCINGDIFVVELGANKVISHILYSFKCHKNEVGVESNWLCGQQIKCLTFLLLF